MLVYATRWKENSMRRRYLTAVALLVAVVVCASADASWMDDARKFQKWCERPAKSMSYGQSEAAQDRFANDVKRQLRLLKIPKADARISIEDRSVTILVDFTYPSPERYVVRRQVLEDGSVRITERIDYAWRVTIVAEKGKLLKSEAVTVSSYETF
jgi:hypothetical protein